MYDLLIRDFRHSALLQGNINLVNVLEQQRAMVKRQERLIEFLFKQHTELLSPAESTGKNDKFDVTQPRHLCGGVCELDTFLGFPHSSFRTQCNHFSHCGTHMVQDALDYLASWSNHYDYTLNKLSLIEQITCWQHILTQDSTWNPDFDFFVKEMQNMFRETKGKLNIGTRL